MHAWTQLTLAYTHASIYFNTSAWPGIVWYQLAKQEVSHDIEYLGMPLSAKTKKVYKVLGHKVCQ